MGLKAITVFEDGALAHVVSADDAAIYWGLTQGRSGVLSVFDKMIATVQTGNIVRIGSGVVSVCGRMARIPSGGFQDVQITSGTSEMYRMDYIVAEYKKTANNETIELKAIMGAPTANVSSIQPPNLIQQDIDSSGDTYQLPLWEVWVSGVSSLNVRRATSIVIPPMSSNTQLFNDKEPSYYATKTSVDSLAGDLEAQEQTLEGKIATTSARHDWRLSSGQPTLQSGFTGDFRLWVRGDTVSEYWLEARVDVGQDVTQGQYNWVFSLPLTNQRPAVGQDWQRRLGWGSGAKLSYTWVRPDGSIQVFCPEGSTSIYIDARWLGGK